MGIFVIPRVFLDSNFRVWGVSVDESTILEFKSKDAGILGRIVILFPTGISCVRKTPSAHAGVMLKNKSQPKYLFIYPLPVAKVDGKKGNVFFRSDTWSILAESRPFLNHPQALGATLFS